MEIKKILTIALLILFMLPVPSFAVKIRDDGVPKFTETTELSPKDVSCTKKECSDTNPCCNQCEVRTWKTARGDLIRVVFNEIILHDLVPELGGNNCEIHDYVLTATGYREEDRFTVTKWKIKKSPQRKFPLQAKFKGWSYNGDELEINTYLCVNPGTKSQACTNRIRLQYPDNLRHKVETFGEGNKRAYVKGIVNCEENWVFGAWCTMKVDEIDFELLE